MTTIAPYHDKEEWLLARQDGLGGSDASAIAALNPYRTAIDVYNEKVEDLPPDEPNWPMRWGNIAEPIAAQLYAEITGRSIRRQPLRRHPEYKFLIANVDRQILAGTAGVEVTAALEIKCPGIGHFSKIKAHGLPDYMILQLQHYLGVLGYSWGSFAIFNSDNGPPIHFDMEADQELIDQLFEREIKFWNDHVVPRIPPTIELDEKSIAVPEIEGELTIIDDPEWNTLAGDLQEAQSLKKSAQQLEDVSKDQIKELMHKDEVHAVEVAGFARFYYKMMKGNTSWKKTAEAVAKEAKLNVKDFEVKGKDYKKFNTFFIK